jgi:putative MATE family efflux protein
MLSHMSEHAYRSVVRLALPALGALAAEPLLVMVDSAIVGHLGTAPLAGLALAGAVLNTTVYLCVFLAYATTAAVARAYGAGRLPDAARHGVDALWLGLGLGVAVGLALWLAAPQLIALFGPTPDVASEALAYLRWSAPGVPAMMAVLAATGVLRGLQNTRVTLHVAVAGCSLNAVLSYLLCYPFGLGIRGAAAATVVAQAGMALWSCGLVVAFARRNGVSLRPQLGGVQSAARSGAPLFLRTCCLQAAGITALWVAAGLGGVELAAQQVVSSVWSLSALGVDALAVAAQALVGNALGAGDRAGLAATKRAVVRLSVLFGAALGLLFATVSPILPSLFVEAPDVRLAATVGLLTAAVCMPLGAWAFALDGILMGAADGTFLAKGMLVALACYLPAAVAVRLCGSGVWGLAALWAVYAGLFMLVRALVYRRRAASIGEGGVEW